MADRIVVFIAVDGVVRRRTLPATVEHLDRRSGADRDFGGDDRATVTAADPRCVKRLWRLCMDRCGGDAYHGTATQLVALCRSTEEDELGGDGDDAASAAGASRSQPRTTDASGAGASGGGSRRLNAADVAHSMASSSGQLFIDRKSPPPSLAGTMDGPSASAKNVFAARRPPLQQPGRAAPRPRSDHGTGDQLLPFVDALRVRDSAPQDCVAAMERWLDKTAPSHGEAARPAWIVVDSVDYSTCLVTDRGDGRLGGRPIGSHAMRICPSRGLQSADVEDATAALAAMLHEHRRACHAALRDGGSQGGSNKLDGDRRGRLDGIAGGKKASDHATEMSATIGKYSRRADVPTSWTLPADATHDADQRSDGPAGMAAKSGCAAAVTCLRPAPTREWDALPTGLPLRGTVKRYSHRRGFGFVSAHGHDVFVHQSSIETAGYRTLRVGALVSFVAVEKAADGSGANGVRYEARGVVPDAPTDDAQPPKLEPRSDDRSGSANKAAAKPALKKPTADSAAPQLAPPAAATTVLKPTVAREPIRFPGVIPLWPPPRAVPGTHLWTAAQPVLWWTGVGTALS
jgi:CspA family cold shock protein